MRRNTILGIIAAVAIAIVGVLTLNKRGMLTTDYPRIAEDLAVLCQSVDADVPWMGGAWLPDSAQELRAHGHLWPDGASFSKGREGPNYELRREGPEGGTEPTTTWIFTVTSREEARHEIARVTIARDRKVPIPEFTDRALKVYAERVQGKRATLADHFDRVAFGFRFKDKAFVRGLLVDSIAKAPQLSEPRIALALFDDDGMKQLEAWAHDKPDVRKLTDAALAHWMLKHVEPAIRFGLEATKVPLKEVPDMNLNASARIKPIASMALDAKRFDDAIAIAKAVQESPDIDRTSRERFLLDWRAIRAAAMYRKGDKAGALAFVATDGLEETDVFYRDAKDVKPLLAKAIRETDDAAVEAWKLQDHSSSMDDALFPGTHLLKQLGLDPGTR